jgi:hypothetical protein
MMARRSPGRATRQILSGADLAAPEETIGGRAPADQPIAFAFRYLVVLAALVLASALAWVLWGMAAASPLLLLLAVGLIASWLVL